MRETAELRVHEELAPRLFADTDGEKLGLVRRIEISTDDPRYLVIPQLEEELRRSGVRHFFAGWNLTRTYASQELSKAELFLLKVTSVFEPPGELCGTVYDEAAACQVCGAGGRQA